MPKSPSRVRPNISSHARCAPFHAAVTPIFDGLRVGRVGFSPGFTFRDDELVKDGDDAIGFTALRLEKALALLSDPGGKLRQISEVAYAVGYSDLSHFNRSFRSRYGDTPTGVRRRDSRQ